MATVASHTTPYAGSWYPGDSSRLQQLLARLFEDSAARTGPFLAPAPLGFVVPHAGLAYSGTVAAAAYRHIQSAQPARIIVLGFAHRGSKRGVWIPEIGGYRTPIGDIDIDLDAVAALRSRGFGSMSEADLCDHSVEIQLPFIRKAAPRAKIVPIYVSRLDLAQRSAAATVLSGYVEPGTVLIASSDFTHYGKGFDFEPFPMDEFIAERLQGFDQRTIEAASSLSDSLFLKSLDESSATVCGRDPIALLLRTLSEADGPDEIFQHTLDYQTSGEITGDYGHCVSYAALGYFRSSSLDLSSADQISLLESAKNTLARYLATGDRRLVPASGSVALEWRTGAFVSLYRGDELRGCLGKRTASEPLRRCVPGLAICAATEDGRFTPVAPNEGQIDIEISVLSPLKRIADRTAFKVDQHGALLEAGPSRSLLLPQVPTERNWTADEFFSALARKARLNDSVYDSECTRLFVFRARVINEE